MDLIEATAEKPEHKHEGGNHGESMEAYLLERPSLLLTFLDAAERYTEDCDPCDMC